MPLVECELAQIMIAEQRFPQVIVLREKGGQRILPITIGLPEALAINRSVAGEEMIRPMTHDLLVAVIASLNGRLDRIVVNEIVYDEDGSGTYHGSLMIESDGETREVDCRPSDAVALAVRTGCRIFVADHVLEDVAG